MSRFLFISMLKHVSKSIHLDRHCVVWPVRYEHQAYGFVTMHCRKEISFPELENEFIAHVIDDIALALFSHETALKLKVERDFNQEIIDTIQALCGINQPLRYDCIF